MIFIDRESEAGRELARILADDADTRHLYIDVRLDGIAIKQNERMWSPTLRTTS